MPFRTETVPLTPHNDQHWTIWVEFQFYLIFPFLLAFSRRLGTRYLWAWLGLLILTRALVFAASDSVRFVAYETIFGRLDQFIIGMLLAHQWLQTSRAIASQPAGHPPGISPLWLLLAALAVLLGVHAFSRKVGFSELASPFWIVWPGIEAALWAAFVWAYLLARWPGPLALRQPIDRALAALGAISFSTYVFHNLVIAAYNARLSPLTTGLGPVADAVATGALLILPSVLAISVITYHLIERPFLAMRGSYLNR